VRALVQRVSRAAVDVDGERVAEIGPGLLVLLGVAHGDTPQDADRLADKVRALRVFPDADGRMNEPLGPGREVLCVSQFTLYGDTRRGNRPSYVDAARPERAEPLYERFCERLGARRGRFGAHMDVELVNDGPVTLLLESGATGRPQT
jgi:D-tyrosyl-tRNA(Tyr) deacylase